MSIILGVSPLEFLLRYSVITGVLIAIVGTAILFLAKHITMAKRKTDEINKNDKLYITLLILGLMFVLIGMIIIALPIDATFYKVQ